MNTISTIPGLNIAGYGESAGTAPSAPAQDGTSFSDALAGAMKDELSYMSIAAGSGTSGLSSGSAPLQMQTQAQTQGLEQMILSAASSGQTTDAQKALFMLCMMMQGDQGGDYSIIMQMMASMLTQIQGDNGSLRDSVMTSDYDPYVLDEIDKGVFNTVLPDGSGIGQVTVPSEAWRPATPAITSTEGTRSPGLYRAVIDQFRVESAERYKPFREGSTYCNIFLWDVTSAMGAEIPHYTDPETGAPVEYPNIKGAKPMGAIATDEWLGTYGPEYGWHEADAETAQRYANEGKPAVTTAGDLGHVQVICPSGDGGFDPIRGVAVAQAGRIVSNYTHLSSIYNTNGQQSVRYWVHD